MRKGRYFLLGGAGIIVSGVVMVVIALQLPFPPDPDDVFPIPSPLATAQSEELSLSVTDVSRPISVWIMDPRNPIEIHAIMTDPEGQVLTDSNVVSVVIELEPMFHESSPPYTNVGTLDFGPTSPGSYTLKMTNTGDSPISLFVSMRHPEVLRSEQLSHEMFAANLGVGGGLIAILGIVVISVGAFWTIKQRQSRAGNLL